MIFPLDSDRWTDFIGADRTIVRAFADESGRYSATLRPGEYYAKALDHGFDDCWASSEQFARWAPSAARFRVTRGSVVLDLPVR
jgi:hypothetical protein